MPALKVADSSGTLGNVLAQTSAEAASLHGHKAKTPMLAGTIIGTIMGVAYIIGFTIYFVKRCKRKRLKRRIEAGQAEPKPQSEREKQEKIVIPPDPAVLLGHNPPGDVIVQEKHHHHHRQKSVPRAHAGGSGSTSNLVRADTDRISEEVTVPADV